AWSPLGVSRVGPFALSRASLPDYVSFLVADEGASRTGSHLPYGPGGYLAYASREFFLAQVARGVCRILLLLLTLTSFLLATELGFYSALQGFRAWLARRKEERGQGLLA